MSDTLAELQTRFAAGLLDPREPPLDLFRGDAELQARRYALYRGNLSAHWERALGNAYPVIRALVGEEFFLGLARSYGRRHACTEGDLNNFGADLAVFLDDFDAARSYPYFADVARLEWALHRAYYAADKPALSAAEFAGIDAEALDGLHLRPRAGVALLASPWACATIWLAHQPGGPSLPRQLDTPSRALIYRPRWRATLRSLGAGEFAALEGLLNGASLGTALEAAVVADADFDPSAALARWIADALFQPLSDGPGDSP